MNVADVMTTREDTVTVEVPGTRDDVLEYLQDGSFSSVPVVKDGADGEEYRGLVTRDALIDRPDEDQLALLAEEVTTTTADTAIEEVARQMVETGDRRVPVVDGGLEGIVTVTDVVRAIANDDLPGDTTVDAVAGREVNCVYAGTPLPVAERELSFARVPYAVVLDGDGELTGMLTEVDVLEVARVVEGEADTGESIANQDDDWAWEGIKAVGNRYMPTRNVELPAESVEEFMTPDLVTVGKRRTVRDAAQLMLEHDIEQIPVVTGDELYGVVRDIDLLEAL
ncbi:CBS domain-containing protein [Salinirussus salinus]|jgi:IMP dehydrogenase|uniref:CBS domain-containing protein n=1 Tax=Salinirussus salinus TaxID=1198300 RepID=UPI00135B0C57|nr:CBS domain-containing protein [Salinirussus salinus]